MKQTDRIARYMAIVLAGALAASLTMTSMADEMPDAAGVVEVTEIEEMQDDQPGDAGETMPADHETPDEISEIGTEKADGEKETEIQEDVKPEVTETAETGTTGDAGKTEGEAGTSTEKSGAAEDETEKVDGETADAAETGAEGTAGAAEDDAPVTTDAPSEAAAGSAEESTSGGASGGASSAVIAEAGQTAVGGSKAGIKAETREEHKLSRDILGTWAVDEYTSLRFCADGSGALIIPDEEIAFTYKIDGDQLYIDFVSGSGSDGVYTASVDDGTLQLAGGEGTVGESFELTLTESAEDSGEIAAAAETVTTAADAGNAADAGTIAAETTPTEEKAGAETTDAEVVKETDADAEDVEATEETAEDTAGLPEEAVSDIVEEAEAGAEAEPEAEAESETEAEAEPDTDAEPEADTDAATPEVEDSVSEIETVVEDTSEEQDTDDNPPETPGM